MTCSITNVSFVNCTCQALLHLCNDLFMSLAAVADPAPDRRGRPPPGPSRRPLRPLKRPTRSITFFARFLSLLRKNGGKLRKILAKLRQTGVKMRKKPGKLRNFRPKRARFAAILRKNEAFSCTFSPNCAHFPTRPNRNCAVVIDITARSIQPVVETMFPILFFRFPKHFSL